MAFCRNCGNELKDGAKFCPKCGSKTDVGFVAPQQTYQPQEESVYDDEEFEELSVGWKILSFLIPLVGFAVYFNNWETSRYKAHSGIVCACWGVVINIVLQYFWWKNFV